MGTGAASKNHAGAGRETLFHGGPRPLLYAQAAAVASQWGVVVEDAVIHQQVQHAGARAEQQAQARIETSAALATAVAVPPDALVIMAMDGWMLRHRGAGWGQKARRDLPGDRVALCREWRKKRGDLPLGPRRQNRR